MFFIVSFLIFSVALFAAGYFIWSVPQQQAEDVLGARMRELRMSTRTRSKARSELVRREHRGAFAFLGDLVTWVGVLRRLQERIEQANLRYRAADVFGICVLLAAAAFVIVGFASGWSLIVLQVLAAAGVGSAPILYI